MKWRHLLAGGLVAGGIVAGCLSTPPRRPLPEPPVVFEPAPGMEHAQPNEVQGPSLANLLYDVREPIQQQGDYARADAALQRVPAQSTASRYVLEAFIIFGKKEYESAAEKVLDIEELILKNPAHLERIQAELGPHRGLADLFQSSQYQAMVREVEAYAKKWYTPRELYFVLATCHLFQQEYAAAAAIVKARPDNNRPERYRALLATLRDRSRELMAREENAERKAALEQLLRKYERALDLLK